MKYITKENKIFVAGHKGMVGSAIIRNLQNSGYFNLLTAERNELDLIDTNKVKNWFKKNKPEIVVIAAAKVGGIYHNSVNGADFIYENLQIQNNLIHGSFKNNIKKLIFLGSSCIYPKYSKQPIKEEYLLSGKLEETNLPYATAKIAGVKMCEAYNKQYKTNYICLMPTNTYGPNDNYSKDASHVMAALIRKFHEADMKNCSSVTCWGSGSPLREFLHVDDLGDAVVFALEYWNPNSDNSPKNKTGQPLTYLNVGTGKDISIKALAEIISKEFTIENRMLTPTLKLKRKEILKNYKQDLESLY